MGPHSPDYFLIRGEAQKPCFLHFSSRLGRLLQQSAFRSKTTIDFAKSPFIAKPLKKRRSTSLKKSTARQQKLFRAPKNHEASILFGKHIANAKDFSIVFEHRDRSREASARRSISVEKSTARQQKKCSGPENRDASISSCKHIANAMIFSTVFGWLGKVTHYFTTAGWLGWLAGLGWLTGRDIHIH